MILSKLFSKRPTTKMTMTEVLLSNSNSGNEQDQAEKPGADRIKKDEQPDGDNEKPDKSIIQPAKGDVR